MNSEVCSYYRPTLLIGLYYIARARPILVARPIPLCIMCIYFNHLVARPFNNKPMISINISISISVSITIKY